MTIGAEIIDMLERRQRLETEKRQLNLAEQLQFLCYGQKCSDVAAAACTILMSCIVAQARDVNHAVEIASKTGPKMAQVIARDYESMLHDLGDDNRKAH